MRVLGTFIALAAVICLTWLLIYETHICRGACAHGSRRCQDMCFAAGHCPHTEPSE